MLPANRPLSHDQVYERARRRRMLRAGLAFLALAIVVAAIARSQQRVTACWGGGALSAVGNGCFPRDESVRPWGPGGGPLDLTFAGSVKDSPAFAARYAAGRPTAGSQPIGHTGEDAIGIFALRNAYAGLCPGVLPTRPGQTEPTAEEVWDLITTVPRWSGPYFACYYAWTPGGTPERAIIVTSENWGEHAGRLTKPGGACALGPLDVAGPGPSWRKHYDIRWLPRERPWCDWVKPLVSDRVEVDTGVWQPGTISRVSGTEISIRLDAGGTRREQFADEGRRWRRLGASPAPTPTPTPQATATPTPTPSCPSGDTPCCSPAPCQPAPSCEPLEAAYQLRLDALLLKLATWPVKAGTRRFVTWRETVEAKQLRDKLPSTGRLSTCLMVP